MAGELTRGIIHYVAEKLADLLRASAVGASSESPGADLDDLRHLERTMNRIQVLLIEADNREIRDISEKHRLKELKEVSLDAEDLVEDYAYEVLREKIYIRNKMNWDLLKKGRTGRNRRVTDLSSILVSVPVPEEIALRVRRIRKRFDEIVNEWESLRFEESDGARRRGFESGNRLPTSSLVHEPSVLGRYQDQKDIVEILLKDEVGTGNNGGNLQVLPIVGMGGVGKTTLAQLVYKDPRVIQHFDLRGWVCVSEELDVKTTSEVILNSLTKKQWPPMQFDILQTTLQNEMEGKKVLLVLDDVWNDKSSFWNSLRTPLLKSPSIRILVTTRNEKIAKIMQTIPFYPLRCLNLKDSWQLFKQVAFENQNPGEHDNLVEIGRKITLKCGGLPLAVKAIGCALHFELKEEMWKYILESDLWESDVGKKEILPALQLSYDCMPVQLKQCFMFLSLFPKDYVFLEDTIIKLWASMDFLKSQSMESIKDIGRLYFDDLIQRSMLQKIQYDEKNCRYLMHDLVHQLAEFEAGELFARVDTLNLNSSSSQVVRYLTVIVNELPKSLDLLPLHRSNSLRILQLLNMVNKWMSKDIIVEIHSGFFENLKCLRIVDFSYTGLKNLPESIGNLKQLRYLGLAKTKIGYLPETIGLLYNLQTLDLLGCPVRSLPLGVSNLVNLEHLIIAKWSNVVMPDGIGHLTNLVTLSAFNLIGRMRGNISELENLEKLQGNLCITGLDNVNSTDAMHANLQSKKQINCLTLSWSDKDSLFRRDPYEYSVFEALKPHPNLAVLEVYRYPGRKYPSWLGDISYSKLVQVSLFGNSKTSPKFLPPLGRLPLLRNLSIQCMMLVNLVGHEFCSCYGVSKGFRSLETLEFKYLPTWVQLSGLENGEFCSLESLKIVRCNALRFLSTHLSVSLNKLVVNHCKELTNLPFLPSLAILILMGPLKKNLLATLCFPSLKSLEVGFSDNTRVIYFNFVSLKSLEVLVIKGCKNLRDLRGLSKFTSLREMELDGCHSLMLPIQNECLPPFLPPFLQVLKVTNCPQLSKLKPFGEKKKDADIEDEFVSQNEEDVDIEADKTEMPIWNDKWGNYNDYGLDWLKQMKKRPVGSSKKRDRHGLMKRQEISLDKGKQVVDYSSGESVGGSSDGELGSYGSTSSTELD